MKEGVFCANMLIDLGFGMEFEKVLLDFDNAVTRYAIRKSAYSSYETHCVKVLLDS